MSEYGKTQIQTLGAGLLAFLGVLGVGMLLILPRGAAPVKAPDEFVVPADAALPMPASAAAPSRVDAPAVAKGQIPSSPAPLPPRSVSAPSGAAPGSSGLAAAPRLSGGASMDDLPTPTSSAQMSATSAPALKKGDVPAKKKFVAPKLDLSKSQGVASSVHYGVTSRAQLMGRAAGPVYNFSGKTGQSASGQKPADFTGQAMEKVDAAQKQIDSSDLDDANKAKVDQSLDRVRQNIKSGAQ